MADDAKNGKGAPRAPSSYIVFRLASQDGKAWDNLGTFPGRTPDDGKRAAAASVTLADGEKIVLAAVPSKSWKPSTAEVVVPEPKLVLA